MTNDRRAVEFALAILATLIIGALIAGSGRIPGPFTTLLFIPILVSGYRHPLLWSLVLVSIASLLSSPAMTPLGVEMDERVMPLLWLGWPAVYLFLAVTMNQWASIRQQRQNLDEVERHLLEMKAHNDRRERELETLSLIQNRILTSNDERALLVEVTERIAQLTGAKLCTIVISRPGEGEGPYVSYGLPLELFHRLFPNGAPYGEGVAGWAIMHGRVASSPDVLSDARYERLRELALAVGFRSTAAAPFDFEKGLRGALLIAYEEPREFSLEELARLERLARQVELAVRSARQRESLARFAFDTALALTEAIESRDPYTGGHCHRLAKLAGQIARHLSLPEREVETVRLGAALHDVGKIVVPDSILRKPDKLTPEEYAIVRQHCYSGGQICKRVPFLMEVYPIVYHHHERWDGNGYPDGLRGEQIPLPARIVAVADAYDSMTSDRPYRQAMSHDRALDILREGAGRQWDPKLVRVFMETVNLSSGKPSSGDGYGGRALAERQVEEIHPRHEIP